METIPYAAMLEDNDATLEAFPISIGEERFGMGIQSLEDIKWNWCAERD